MEKNQSHIYISPVAIYTIIILHYDTNNTIYSYECDLTVSKENNSERTFFPGLLRLTIIAYKVVTLL